MIHLKRDFIFQQAYRDLDNDGKAGLATKAKLFDLYG